MPVRRGEIWWVDFDPTQGSEIRKTRPAIVLARLPCGGLEDLGLDGGRSQRRLSRVAQAGVVLLVTPQCLGTRGVSLARRLLPPLHLKRRFRRQRLADQLRAQRHSFDAQPTDRAGLEAFIRSYLSPEHRDHCADGCPSAALLDEIGRRPERTRQVFTDELMGVIDDIASRLDATRVDAARTDALTLFGLMVGTLQLARALADRDLSDRLLAQGVEAALKMLEDAAP